MTAIDRILDPMPDPRAHGAVVRRFALFRPDANPAPEPPRLPPARMNPRWLRPWRVVRVKDGGANRWTVVTA